VTTTPIATPDTENPRSPLRIRCVQSGCHTILVVDLPDEGHWGASLDHDLRDQSGAKLDRHTVRVYPLRPDGVARRTAIEPPAGLHATAAAVLTEMNALGLPANPAAAARLAAVAHRSTAARFGQPWLSDVAIAIEAPSTGATT
jgi:hypothetical protein